MQDPHRFVNDLDEAAHERLIARLEGRARDPVFSSLLEKYIDNLNLHPESKILEIGCGTGVVLRTLVRRYDVSGKAYGVDHCDSFIRAANEYSRAEGTSENLLFEVGDAHQLEYPAGTFDLVIAHTLLSHVTEPVKVLGEIARVLKNGGIAVIFDGDYTSLTYAYPDHSFGRKMDLALANATFNNPLIMRDLPRLLKGFGLEMKDAWGDAVVEIGEGSYFRTFAETYVPYVKEAGILPTQAVDIWLDEQRRAMETGIFFAACNYYTYTVRRNDLLIAE